jgi:hypothetical protein
MSENTIKINNKIIGKNISQIIITVAVFTPFLIYYLQIDEKLKNKLLTKSFLICLIEGLYELIDYILQLRYHLINYDKEMFIIDYDKDLDFGYWRFIKSLFCIIIIINSLYLMGNFIPIKNNNCHGYGIVICNYGRMYGVLMIIGLIISLLFILWLGWALFKIKLRRNARQSNMNIILKYLNILEEDCPICLSSDSEIKCIETKCGHKFHEDCIKSYVIIKNTCPICRQDLTSDNIVNLHKIGVDV